MDKPKTIRERFPPPWRIVETDGNYCVMSSNGKRLAYVYGHSDFHVGALEGKVSFSEARAIAMAIAKMGDGD